MGDPRDEILTVLNSSIVAEVEDIITVAGLLPFSLLRDGGEWVRRWASFCLREVDRWEDVEVGLVLIESIVGCELDGKGAPRELLPFATEVSVVVRSLSSFVVLAFGRPASL